MVQVIRKNAGNQGGVNLIKGIGFSTILANTVFLSPYPVVQKVK
nr:MAG TPA: hypothetical protein [Caudoviricetes sp.]